MIIIISLGDEFTEPRDAPDSSIIKTFSIKMGCQNQKSTWTRSGS